MRKKALYLNTLASVTNMFITLACGFILPRFILKGFGSEVNGLVSSINQFLSFITLMDLGVGAVIQSSYYKPLAENNKKELSLLYVSSQKFFRSIAYALLVYIIILCFFFPSVIDNKFSVAEIDLLIVIMAIGLFAQYFVSVSDQLLLNADQKLYIQTGFQTITVIINTVLSILLIYSGASIHVVKLGSSIVFLSRPFFYNYYVRKHYDIDRTIDTTGYKIEQKWNGLAQHIATVIMNNTDVMVLTILSPISTVSIYSVYAMVTNGIKQFINALSNGFFSLLGDLYARKEIDKLKETFSFFQFLINIVTVFFYSVALMLIVPFVSIYTSGVNDANYHQPVFSFFLIAGQAIFCLRIPYNTMICSAGHYRQTQFSAILEAVLNIIISVLLVFNLGLVGVAVGTLIAIVYRTTSFCIYLHNNILWLNYKILAKLYIIDLLEFILIFFVGNIVIRFLHENDTIIGFLICGVILSMIALIVIVLMNLIFYRREFFEIKRYLLGKIKK